MIKRIGSMVAVALLSASIAFAAGSVSGKVTKIEGDKVTVTVEGAVPAWAKTGANVSAAGGAPKVVSVQGNEVTLRFSKSKAAKIKVDSKMKLTESEGDELQGC